MNIPDIIKQISSLINIADIIICLPGLILLACWLVKTSWGKNALADSIPRRNNMPFYLPFIPLFVWFGAVALAISITRELLSDWLEWQMALLDNLILCIGGLIGIAVIIFLARVSFVRRLKGFGLNVKTILNDFGTAVLNLLAVWPIVTLMIILTLFFGKLIWGQDFQLQQHEELELITAYPQISVRVLIIITAVVVVPVFEEMLFRGLFQTMLRSSLAKPWLSIAISSGLFAIVHQSPGHWPALFALSMCLGYSYEKSGSLFQPIFVHSLFNATSIIATLNQ